MKKILFKGLRRLNDIISTVHWFFHQDTQYLQQCISSGMTCTRVWHLHSRVSGVSFMIAKNAVRRGSKENPIVCTSQIPVPLDFCLVLCPGSSARAAAAAATAAANAAVAAAGPAVVRGSWNAYDQIPWKFGPLRFWTSKKASYEAMFWGFKLETCNVRTLAGIVLYRSLVSNSCENDMLRALTIENNSCMKLQKWQEYHQDCCLAYRLLCLTGSTFSVSTLFVHKGQVVQTLMFD